MNPDCLFFHFSSRWSRRISSYRNSCGSLAWSRIANGFLLFQVSPIHWKFSKTLYSSSRPLSSWQHILDGRQRGTIIICGNVPTKDSEHTLIVLLCIAKSFYWLRALSCNHLRLFTHGSNSSEFQSFTVALVKCPGLESLLCLVFLASTIVQAVIMQQIYVTCLVPCLVFEYGVELYWKLERDSLLV